LFEVIGMFILKIMLGNDSSIFRLVCFSAEEERSRRANSRWDIKDLGGLLYNAMGGFLMQLDKIRKTTRYWIETICSAILFFMATSLFAQVVLRRFARYTLSWPEEMAVVAMVFITFFGSYVLIISNDHLKLDIISEKVPAQCICYFNIINRIIVSFFLFIICVNAFYFIQKAGVAAMPITGISMRYVYGFVWFSCILMLFEVIIQIIIEVKKVLYNRS